MKTAAPCKFFLMFCRCTAGAEGGGCWWRNGAVLCPYLNQFEVFERKKNRRPTVKKFKNELFQNEVNNNNNMYSDIFHLNLYESHRVKRDGKSTINSRVDYSVFIPMDVFSKTNVLLLLRGLTPSPQYFCDLQFFWYYTNIFTVQLSLKAILPL